MTTVPFRAGRLPGETAAAAAHATREFEAGTSVVLLADISEFQPDLNDAAYLAWSQAVIFRAMYGTTTDRAWYSGARRAGLHAGGARFVGIYQYVVAGEDITAQARALASLLGKLQPGEKVIADIEEGSGSQQGRWQTWAGIIQAATGDPPWDYSGLSFAADHGLQPVDWVAAYGSNEPSVPHQLWQFTDSRRVPGLPGPVDCSVYHGTIDRLAALAYQGKAHPPPPPPPHPVLREGASGAAVVTMQKALNAHGARLAADGAFGPATLAAVKTFQVSRRLTADGICGPLTWRALAA